MKNVFSIKVVEDIFNPLVYKMTASKRVKDVSGRLQRLYWFDLSPTLSQTKLRLRCNIIQKDDNNVIFHCIFFGGSSEIEYGEFYIKLFYEDGVQMSDFTLYANEPHEWTIDHFKLALEHSIREKLKADNKLFKEVFDDV